MGSVSRVSFFKIAIFWTLPHFSNHSRLHLTAHCLSSFVSPELLLAGTVTVHQFQSYYFERPSVKSNGMQNYMTTFQSESIPTLKTHEGATLGIFVLAVVVK